MDWVLGFLTMKFRSVNFLPVSVLSQTLPASYVHGVNPRLDYFIHARAISILNTAAHAKQINEPLLCLEQTMQETC